MAQIIKHRRGSIDHLKTVIARKGEFVVATGSIGTMSGPWVFVGDDEIAGGYRATSKIYEGSTVPTVAPGNFGTVIDGTPFYSTTDEALYVLASGGNRKIDLTGNIEGNAISGVTINNLTGSNANITSITGSVGNFTSSLTGSHVKVDNSLTVGGNSVFTGDITGSNLRLSGDANILGNIVLGGNITVGDSDTDFVTFSAEISSSIVPDINNSFDLGSTTKYWRNLYVSGTAYVNVLEAQSISLDEMTVFDDLSVSGNTFLGNGSGDIVVISGSIFNDSLTNNRVVIVGTEGLLEDDANFVFDGTQLNVGQGGFTVQQSSGNIDTAGTLNVGGATTLESTLVVTGSSEFKNNVGIGGTLNVTGSAVLKNTLQVDSTSQLKGSVGINSTLDVTGSTVLKSTLEGRGAVGFNSTLDVTGSTVLKNTLSVSGATTIDGLTTINDDAVVNGVLTVTGNTQLGGDLFVSGNLQVLGGATSVIIQSQTVEIDDNIIRLNAFSPFERYAGFEVMDSGSVGMSASLVWDSLNDYWMFVSSTSESSKLIGTTPGTYGSEISLTTNTIPKATDNSSIGNSLLTDNGTTLAYNTNKFTVTASDGATLIAGSVTLSSAGGTDSLSNSSAIVFRNNTNVVGYVSTTETTDVMDGILGYKSSDGGLVFSTVIDGGTY